MAGAGAVIPRSMAQRAARTRPRRGRSRGTAAPQRRRASNSARKAGLFTRPRRRRLPTMACKALGDRPRDTTAFPARRRPVACLAVNTMPHPDAHAMAGATTGLLPLAAAAELQDHLLVASNDLERLQRLLDDAARALLEHFTGASALMEAALRSAQGPQPGDAAVLQQAQASLGQAVTALQFQDMASQLIHHTSRRLRSCADRLAAEAFAADDDDEGEAVVQEAPRHPNPVTQDEMDAGSIELF